MRWSGIHRSLHVKPILTSFRPRVETQSSTPEPSLAVGREYILSRYRAYGGPKPPTIDHQGIDDAFLEKASVVHYFHAGKWRKLTGADLTGLFEENLAG